MVILADELLQQFFETSFPASFHLSPTIHRTSTSSSTLTTFSTPANLLPVPSNRVVPPGNKGLRGVLDNIVSDGMRVAQEVKKRMDEAQRELEKSAVEAQRPHGVDEDEEDEDARGHGNDDRRSVLEGDRDLLEGAEAEVVVEGKGEQEGTKDMGRLIDTGVGGGEEQREGKEKVVEFER